jgi:predicted metal-dependent enzyme (double-stranded beta helix superfamily)
MAAGERVEGPDGAEVVLGEVGGKIVFENEQVRVWDVTLEPGEEQPWHRHHHPYLVVALEAADNRITPIDGSPPRDVHEALGAVVYRDWADVHKLRNRGTTRYRSRLVELKCLGEPTGASPI